jgi:hypothetical protein
MVRRIHRSCCLTLAVVALATVDAWCDTPSGSGVRGADSTAKEERAAVPPNGGTTRPRLYASNARAGVLDVLDWRENDTPTLRKRVEFGPNAVIRNVVVSPRGFVAVGLSGASDANGRLVLLDEDGGLRRSIALPHAPERLLTSEDGRVIVAVHAPSDSEVGDRLIHRFSVVEGERSAGAVTIVTALRAPALSGRVQSSETDVRELTEEEVLALEDGARFAVLLPKQRVRVVVERASLRVLAVEHFDPVSQFGSAHYEVERLPAIGQTAAGQTVHLGGFSGLYYAGRAANGNLSFITHTDRGPNGEMMDQGRPFLLPRFNPRLVWLELDPKSSRAQVVRQLPLTQADGSPLLGLPNVYSFESFATSMDEVPVDLRGELLPRQPLGADFEGMAVAHDGSFWLADEYRPSLYHFDQRGRLLQRVVPIGSHAAAGLIPPAPGETGPLGVEALPSVLLHRRQNRGFEAVAFQSGKVYAMVQSPMRHPATLSDEMVRRMRNVRLIELDPVRLTTRQFIYVMDHPARASAEDSPADKIGDMTALPGGGFLVIERDDDARPEDVASNIHKKVYFFRIDSATEISNEDNSSSGQSLDQLSVGALLKRGIKPIEKRLYVDLVAAGYHNVQKVEGLAWIDEDTIAVVNDNDFGVGRISIEGSTGRFTLLPDYRPEPVMLGVISRKRGK